MSVEDTLSQRGEFYGDFPLGCESIADMMTIAKNRYRMEHGIEMPEIDRVHLSYAFLKLHRLFVSPRHEDSWHDLSGYSRLIEQHCKEMNNADQQRPA